VKETFVKTALQKFHFIGICGTAMGSAAAALRQRGFKVSGSDENVHPPMSIFLEQHGIKFHQGNNSEATLTSPLPIRCSTYSSIRKSAAPQEAG
jgi:UDP-N-acetylmuramate-alanine ligase